MKLCCLLLLVSLTIFIDAKPKTTINVIAAENSTISVMYNVTNISYKHNNDIRYQIINIFII
jgi:hypothetical protein